MTTRRQERGISTPGGGGRQAGDDGRPAGDTVSGITGGGPPDLSSEVYESLSRATLRRKAEAVAADVGVSRAQLYKIMAAPWKFPVGGLIPLSHHDPDPEFLARCAGHLLAAVSSAALLRRAQGRAITIVGELPVEATAEAIRRATGRTEFGDD